MPGITKEERERRQEVIPEIATKYLEGEEVEDLSKEYNIPENSIYYYFRKIGVSRKDQSKRQRMVLEEISDKVEEDLSMQGEKLATIAIGIGGVIANRYLPLVDSMMSEGMTLEFIAEQIMEWFEQKQVILSRMDRLDTAINRLEEEVALAYSMAMPNFRYLLRTRILDKYAKDVLKARAMGIRLPVKQTIEAFNRDLIMLEKDVDTSLEGLLSHFEVVEK
jgi:hypothetical protein